LGGLGARDRAPSEVILSGAEPADGFGQSFCGLGEREPHAPFETARPR
jgi:hypothetical protein